MPSSLGIIYDEVLMEQDLNCQLIGNWLTFFSHSCPNMDVAKLIIAQITNQLHFFSFLKWDYAERTGDHLSTQMYEIK